MKYNQEEESTFRKELFRRMDDQDRQLKEIKEDGKKTMEQATKTNGRATVLELKMNDYDTFKKTVDGLAGWKIWLMATAVTVLFCGGIMCKLFLASIYRTAQDNAQKAIIEQKEGIINDAAEKVVNLIENKYDLKIVK